MKLNLVRKISPNRDVLIILVVIFILGSSLLLPAQLGLSVDGQKALGLLLVASILWITEVIPLAVTGILIMALQPILGIMSADEVFSNFGSGPVFFLIGTFILAAAIEKYNLHKRIALMMLKYFHSSPQFFIFGTMIVGAFLSFLISCHAVAVLFLPILMHILTNLDVRPKKSNFGIVTMLALTYGTSIGSLGTFLGGARNPLTMGFIQENLGYTISFTEWMKYSVPVVIPATLLVYLILIFLYKPERKDLSQLKETIEDEVKELGPLQKEEKRTIGIYGITLFLWIFFSTQVNVSIIALLGAVLMFAFEIVSWKDVEEHVQWGIILLYGGAITLGISLQATGASEWIALRTIHVVGSEPTVALFTLVITTVILTQLMSDTAAVALMLPIGLGLATELPGLSPALALIAIALSGGSAFVLVIATPSAAIAYSSGYFSQKNLIKAGVFCSLIFIIVLFLISKFVWPLLGGI